MDDDHGVSGRLGMSTNSFESARFALRRLLSYQQHSQVGGRYGERWRGEKERVGGRERKLDR